MAPSLMLNKMPMTPFRIMAFVAGVAAVCLVVSALRTTGQQHKLGAVLRQASSVLKRDTVSRTMAPKDFWRKVDLQAEELPQNIEMVAAKVEVKENRINIMGTETYYREAHPPNGVTASGEDVVLLHGAAFKSETWLNLNTIHLLAAMGHHVIAIDLPGYGETPKMQPSSNPEAFLVEFLNKLNVVKPIMVSPSMSGGFSIPFIMAHPDGLDGYVPVAPVNTKAIVSRASSIMIPTLIIYGEKDHSLGISSRDDLINIPTSQAVEIPGAKHPAYLDNPKMFHTLLYNFIKQVMANKA